uniref:Lipoprotein n=1 Tax=Caulobacter phage BL57 TaxID=3348355 RepID=A0AB74UIT9_9VIRU
MRDEAAKKARVNYAWRMEVVKVCRQSRLFVLRGVDGRLWLSSYTNPGKVASNGGVDGVRSDGAYYDTGNRPADWEPSTYMSRVGAVNPKDVCQ